MLATAAAVAGLVGMLLTGPAATAATPSGTLTLTTVNPAPGAALTFSYATDRPNTKNWVAIYNDPATGPTDEKTHGASTDWAYVDATTASGSGTVTIPSTALTPGHDLVAYFLYSDGYTWLAQPVTFRVGYATTGSLQLTTAAPRVGGDLTFTYATGKANPAGKDWIALYDDTKNAPVNQTYPGRASTAWSYVTGTSGSVTIPAGTLTAGHDVIAFLLDNDGYAWLAEPLTFRLATASTGPTADGTLKLLTTDPVAGQPLQFSFTTSTPNAKNWIGIYDDPSTIPTGGQSHGGSTTWAYVPNATSGTVTIPAGGLTGGHTVGAVLLYNDGYVNLAPSLTFALTAQPPLTGSPNPTTDHFVTDDVVEPATRPAAAVALSVGGLWFGVAGADAAAATFAKQSGPDWISVSASGAITGTAPSSIPAHPPLVTITATEATGVTGTLTVELPVAEPGAPPVVHAATLDLWDGGTHVDDSLEKTVRSILTNRFDLLGLQHTGGARAAAVAQRLGWNAVESATGLAIVAPFRLTPLADPAGAPMTAATANVGGTEVTVWNTALDAGGPDPAAVCTAGASAAVDAEKSTQRYAEARAIADAARALRSASPKARLLLIGALNSPSVLDWTGAGGNTDCGAGRVDWPVTAAIRDAGLSDAYRAARPDIQKNPGATAGILTPAVPAPAVSAAVAHPAILDRLDYIHFAGPLTVQNANTVVDGFPAAAPASAANRWPSDRAAVEATLLLAAPPSGGSGGNGGNGANPGPSDPHNGGAASGPEALAWTGSALWLTAGAFALAALIVGTLLLISRRRRIAAVTPIAALAEEADE